MGNTEVEPPTEAYKLPSCVGEARFGAGVHVGALVHNHGLTAFCDIPSPAVTSRRCQKSCRKDRLIRTRRGGPGNRSEVLYGKKLLIRDRAVFLSLPRGLVPAPWGSLGAGLHLPRHGTCSLPPTRSPQRAATFVSASCWLVLFLKMFSAWRVGKVPV